MKQKLLLLILFITLSGSPIIAQYKYSFSQFLSETGDFAIQPLKWDGYDYLKIGLVFAGSGLTMFADQPIRDAVLRDHNQKYYESAPMRLGRMYGSLGAPIAFFCGFAAYSLITDDLWSRKVAYEIGQASLYGGGLVYIMKVAIGRARPGLNKGNATYHPFSSLWDEKDHSFPGGHSTAATIISTVLARNVDPVWLKALCYVPAAITVVSRVYQDFHWTSDCVFGAAFGYYIGTWVVDQHEKPVKSDSKDTGQSLMERTQIQPFFTGDIYGLNISIKLF
jgi:membrane-associated phospholipid phosphatase